MKIFPMWSALVDDEATLKYGKVFTIKTYNEFINAESLTGWKFVFFLLYRFTLVFDHYFVQLSVITVQGDFFFINLKTC